MSKQIINIENFNDEFVFNLFNDFIQHHAKHYKFEVKLSMPNNDVVILTKTRKDIIGKNLKNNEFIWLNQHLHDKQNYQSIFNLKNINDFPRELRHFINTKCSINII